MFDYNFLYSKIKLVALPFSLEERDTIGNNKLYTVIEFLGVFITILLLALGIYFVLTYEIGENRFLVILITSITVLILSSTASLLYRLIINLVFKFKSKNINVINPRQWIIFLILIITELLLFLYGVHTYSTIVTPNQGYAYFYDGENHGGPVVIEGDWIDDKDLVEEIRNQRITCNKDSGECVWITASVQKWNDNYLSVDMTTFPIKEWNNLKIRAEIQSYNRIEEITIYRKNCKMVYIKSPIKQTGEDFTPDNITLTMKASYCE